MGFLIKLNLHPMEFIKYLLLFILVPLFTCIIYYFALKSNKSRTIFACNFVKSLIYIYIGFSIGILNQSEPYYTGLALTIAILEGGFGMISAQNNYKNN